MERKDGVVLRLREAVAVLEGERIGIDGATLFAGNHHIAVFVEDEDVERGRLRDVRLLRDRGEIVLEALVDDANRRPVVEILARRHMLRGGLDRRRHLGRQRLGTERADRTTVEQDIDGVIMQ